MAAELILASVTTVLKAVYDEAEQASENKEALMNLARKARDVLAPQLAVMQKKIKGSKADHVLPALTFLDTCLRNVSALIKKRGKKRAAMQLPLDTIKRRAAKVKAEIEGAESNLFQALQMMSSALQISCMQMIEQNFGAAAKDATSKRFLTEQPWKLRFEDLKYEINRMGKPVQAITLGSGGFGIVFRATYQPDGREVAVKAPHVAAELHCNKVLSEAFLREAHNHYKLLHPNVVTMIGGVCVCTFIITYTLSLSHSLPHFPIPSCILPIPLSFFLSLIFPLLHSFSFTLSFFVSVSLLVSPSPNPPPSHTHTHTHTHSYRHGSRRRAVLFAGL